MPTYAVANRAVAGAATWRHTFISQSRAIQPTVMWRHVFAVQARVQTSPARWVLVAVTSVITRPTLQTRLFVSAGYIGSKGSSPRPSSGLLFPARRR